MGDRGRHAADSPLPVRNSDENKIYRAGGWRKLNGSQVGPAEKPITISEMMILNKRKVKAIEEDEDLKFLVQKNSLFPDDIPTKSNLSSGALHLRPGDNTPI
ncbi:hypothetical protein CDAR_565561 [Caerostris darwini]|uniref:Uncharacterized protein n=1 Tax=Caerostris darwini TaxID=1538125 RepID=A0AAV4MPD9_9ARAC|nr:hypothetical protein CDAR_565561 [Caerostris darwini]